MHTHNVADTGIVQWLNAKVGKKKTGTKVGLWRKFQLQIAVWTLCILLWCDTVTEMPQDLNLEKKILWGTSNIALYAYMGRVMYVKCADFKVF